MGINNKEKITVQITVHAPVERVWTCWTTPEDIVGWNHASDDWHTTQAENNLHKGGRFKFRMEARNGSDGFDFGGTYTNVVLNKRIDYTLDDERKVTILFLSEGNKTKVVETFEAESIHSAVLQRNGWQSILNNFKIYAEARSQRLHPVV